MRTVGGACLLALLLSAGAGRTAAGPADDVLRRAVRAHGWDKIEALAAADTRTKGTLFLSGRSYAFTQRILFQRPGRLRETLEMEAPEGKLVLTTVFDEDRGWISRAGQTRALEDRALAEARESVYLALLTRLTTIRGPRFRLSALGERPVEGKPALGVRVSADGHRDVDLYFDKSSGLLVKTRRQAVDPTSGNPLTEERYFGGYRPFQGVWSARKLRVERNDVKFMEVEVTELRFLDKLPEDTFSRP